MQKCFSTEFSVLTMSEPVLIDDEQSSYDSATPQTSRFCEPSANELPPEICVCSERKRHRCYGKVHLIESDSRYRSVVAACEQDEDGTLNDETDSQRSAKRRAQIDERDTSSIRGCCDGDLVERFRGYMRELLEKRLAESAIAPLPSNRNNNKATNTYILETIETLLFSSAGSLEEYADITTLGERLTRLLVALLSRRLRISGGY